MSPAQEELAAKAFAAAQMVLATPPGMAVERNIAAHGDREYELRTALAHRDDLLAPSGADDLTPADAIARAADLRQTEDRIEAIAPGLLEQLVAEPVSLTQVQGALAPRQGLLMLLETGDAAYAWMVTGACVSWVQLTDNLVNADTGAAEELRQAFIPSVRVRGGSRTAKAQDAGAARALLERLHQGLLGPFETQLVGVDELFIHGSNRFLGLPFAALIDPADGRYEVEKRGFALIPSLRALVGEVPRSGPEDAGHAILALGAPAASMLPDGRSFPTLPGARRELKELRQAFGASVRVLDEKQATEKALLAALADKPSDVLLFSTHAVLDGKGSDDVGLLLSGEPSSSFGALLSLDRIAALPLSGQLVVLSACDTWSGKPGAQEALNGLALAFLSAGARDLVVTQWPISDQSAGRWSHLFLEDLGKDDLVSAVRHSQLELMQSDGGRWSDPSHWASYVPVVGRGTR